MARAFDENGREVVLRPWQERGVAQLREAIEKGLPVSIISEPPGSGKTLTVLMAIADYLDKHKKALVLVPYASISTMWTKYRIINDEGREIKIALFHAKRFHRCWLEVTQTADSPIIPCNDVKKSFSDKLKSCIYYAPPTWDSSNPKLRKVGEYQTIWGKKQVNVHALGGACDYYKQYQEIVDADVIVMTHTKFFYEYMYRRVPKPYFLVIDEAEMFPQELIAKFYLSEEDIDKLAKALQGVSPNVVAELIAIKHLLKKGMRQININQLLELYEKAYGRRPGPFNYSTAYVSNGKILLLHDYYFNVQTEVMSVSKMMIGIVGTPLEDSEIAEILRVRNFYKISNNQKLLGRLIVYSNGQMPVKGIWFKRPDMYKGEVEMVCGELRKFFEWSEKLKLPVFIPVITYRHVILCRDVVKEAVARRLSCDEDAGRCKKTGRFIEDEIVDKTGKHIEEFIEGKRDILITAKANRGIHFPQKTLAQIIVKRPWPDLEDPFVKWLQDERGKYNLSTRYRKMVELHGRATLFHMLGRSIKSEDDTVVVFTPDRNVIDTIEQIKGIIQIDVTYAKSVDEIASYLFEHQKIHF